MTNTQRKSIALPSDEEETRIQTGIAQDPDNPELTDEELAAMRPAREVLPPALYAALTAADQSSTAEADLKKLRRKRLAQILAKQEGGKVRLGKARRRRRVRPALKVPEKQRA